MKKKKSLIPERHRSRTAHIHLAVAFAAVLIALLGLVYTNQPEIHELSKRTAEYTGAALVYWVLFGVIE